VRRDQNGVLKGRLCLVLLHVGRFPLNLLFIDFFKLFRIQTKIEIF
jgi:hypothetical protein